MDASLLIAITDTKHETILIFKTYIGLMYNIGLMYKAGTA